MIIITIVKLCVILDGFLIKLPLWSLFLHSQEKKQCRHMDPTLSYLRVFTGVRFTNREIAN